MEPDKSAPKDIPQCTPAQLQEQVHGYLIKLAQKLAAANAPIPPLADGDLLAVRERRSVFRLEAAYLHGLAVGAVVVGRQSRLLDLDAFTDLTAAVEKSING